MAGGFLAGVGAGLGQGVGTFAHKMLDSHMKKVSGLADIYKAIASNPNFSPEVQTEAMNQVAALEGYGPMDLKSYKKHLNVKKLFDSQDSVESRNLVEAFTKGDFSRPPVPAMAWNRGMANPLFEPYTKMWMNAQQKREEMEIERERFQGLFGEGGPSSMDTSNMSLEDRYTKDQEIKVRYPQWQVDNPGRAETWGNPATGQVVPLVQYKQNYYTYNPQLKKHVPFDITGFVPYTMTHPTTRSVTDSSTVHSPEGRPIGRRVENTRTPVVDASPQVGGTDSTRPTPRPTPLPATPTVLPPAVPPVPAPAPVDTAGMSQRVVDMGIPQQLQSMFPMNDRASNLARQVAGFGDEKSIRELDKDIMNGPRAYNLLMAQGVWIPDKNTRVEITAISRATDIIQGLGTTMREIRALAQAGQVREAAVMLRKLQGIRNSNGSTIAKSFQDQTGQLSNQEQIWARAGFMGVPETIIANLLELGGWDGWIRAGENAIQETMQEANVVRGYIVGGRPVRWIAGVGPTSEFVRARTAFEREMAKYTDPAKASTRGAVPGAPVEDGVYPKDVTHGGKVIIRKGQKRWRYTSGPDKDTYTPNPFD